ncbi:uncharacterized protein C8Q71DRAFT_858074 [Rhodofomes roseus]|uniref:F-box domain-containing protein n=1 Tax=Rhodofomes roseus TaxID=34475 RepID=A0ABQ8KEK2_9APHY|nr:uncharacterized protein C8Q71DRAFT_858074 [Rhodofomes roseus]KAH9836059.1 hypothetical protein C8Q71DRAFT_858074 [Rhodofomes roseus]
MNVLTGNYDVLRSIVDMLSPQEAIPLSSTSRDLHSASRRHAFSRAKPRSHDQLVRMHDCLTRNVDDRTIWPRKLIIGRSITWIPARYGDAGSPMHALVGILRHAHDLEAMEFTDFEEALEQDREIGECLVTLPCLSELHLGGIGAIAVDVFCRMMSRPKTVHLHEFYFDVQIMRIARAAVMDNVQQLCLFDLGSNDLVEVDPQPLGLESHPSLQTLRLRSCVVYPFLTLFPNIRRLTVRHGDFLIGDAPERHLQLQHLSIDASATIPALATDSLELHLTSRVVDSSEELTNRISEAVVFRLSIQPRFRALAASGTALIRTISTRVSRVRYFILILKTDGQSESINWMKNTLPMLASAQLVCMRVDTQGTFDSSIPRPTRWPTSMQQMETARLFHLPSLRFYSQRYDIRDLHDRSLIYSKVSWGRVERDGGRYVLKPISNVAGEAIHRYLQSPEFSGTLQFDEGAALRYA